MDVQNLFKIKVYSVGTYQKKIQLNQSIATPQHTCQHFQYRAWSWKFEMLADVLGCCNALIELKKIWWVPRLHNYILDYML